MRIDMVMITCGSKKLDHPAPAGDLYVGAFFAAQKRAALSLKARTMILSSTYGFIAMDQVIAPYNSRWAPEAIASSELLLTQVEMMALPEKPTIICLGGRAYADRAKAALPGGATIIWPPAHLPNKGMGWQSRLYKAIATLGRLPSQCITDCTI